MRTVARLSSLLEARYLGAFLRSKGIENEVDEEAQVWVYEEDDLILAKQWVGDYLLDSRIQDSLATDLHIQKKEAVGVWKRGKEVADHFSKFQAIPGIITKIVLVLCIALFAIDELGIEIPSSRDPFRNVPFGRYTEIERGLMFDIPRHPRAYWRGFYAKALAQKQIVSTEFWTFHRPMFEKIQQGEIWRLFTPALLHGGLVHIAFNLLWLHVLGRQMEERLGAFRYLLFILVTGIAGNVSQYLMSGFQFVGLSGVICGMVAFVWVRQQLAAWEGYDLQRSTFNFLATFILGVAALQALSFVMEMSGQRGLPIGIANTAHIMGAVAGGALGSLQFFSWKNTQ